MWLCLRGRQSDGARGAQKIWISITWSSCVSSFMLSCGGTETWRQGVRLSLYSKVLVHWRMKWLWFGKARCHWFSGHSGNGFVSGYETGFCAGGCLWLTGFCNRSLQNSYELSGTLGYLFHQSPLPSPLTCFYASCSSVLAEMRNSVSEAIL